VSGIDGLAEKAEAVHVMVKTNYEDFAVPNARQWQMLLEQEQGRKGDFHSPM
jgi:hypothetical protein